MGYVRVRLNKEATALVRPKYYPTAKPNILYNTTNGKMLLSHPSRQTEKGPEKKFSGPTFGGVLCMYEVKTT